MKDQFLFIEEGSIDALNLRKFLDVSGMTDANIIRYKQGAPKPELASIQYDDAAVRQIRLDAKKEQTAMVLKNLEDFLSKNTELHKFFDEMIYAGRCVMKYDGTPESFIDKFKVFMDEDEK